MSAQVSIPDLARRWSRALQMDRGAQFSAEELALLATIGVNDLIQTESAKQLRDQCLQRSVRNRSTSAEITGSTNAKGGRTLKSSGTTANDDASEALAQARRITGKG